MSHEPSAMVVRGPSDGPTYVVRVRRDGRSRARGRSYLVEVLDAEGRVLHRQRRWRRAAATALGRELAHRIRSGRGIIRPASPR